MKQLDEGMGGREFLGCGQDILGNRIENAGILPEDGDIEDFLWITESKMLELRVKASMLRSEVRNSQACANLRVFSMTMHPTVSGKAHSSSRKDDDVGRLL